MNLKLYVSKRFIKSYHRAVFSLQKQVEGCVHDFVNRWYSDPKTITQVYGRVAGLQPYKVLEMDISGGCRLLANYSDNKLILLDMGGHNVVGDYDKRKYKLDIEKHDTAPEQFLPECRSDLFLRIPDQTTISKYPAETSSDWLYFLEKEQDDVVYKIIKQIEKKRSSAHFIMGGPGTGKTSILLTILKYFFDSHYRVGIEISDQLQKHLEKSTQICLSQFRVSSYKIDN